VNNIEMVISNTGFNWLKKVIHSQLSVVTEISDCNTKADSKFEPSMAVRETSVQNVNRKYKCLRIFLEGQLSLLFVKSSLYTPHNNEHFMCIPSKYYTKSLLFQESLLPLTHAHTGTRASALAIFSSLKVREEWYKRICMGIPRKIIASRNLLYFDVYLIVYCSWNLKLEAILYQKKFVKYNPTKCTFVKIIF
jgi:hypothetical protein